MGIQRSVQAVVALLVAWAPAVAGQVPPCVGCNPPAPSDPPSVQPPPPSSQITNVLTDPLVSTVLHSTMASRSRRIAFVTHAPTQFFTPNRLYVVEADGTGLREVHTTSKDIGEITISGDGRMLAWVEGFFDVGLGGWDYNDICTADLETGSIMNLTEDLFFFPKKQVFVSFDMTDAGDVIYATRIADQFGSFGPSELDMWRLATDGSTADKIPGKFGLLTVSGDGKTIALTKATVLPTISILDADGEEQFSFTLPPAASGGSPKDFDYAGERLLVQGGPQCWSVALQTLRLTPQQPGAFTGHISGDGRWVSYYLVLPGSLRDIYRARFDGSEPLKIQAGANAHAGDISFDGSVISFAKKSLIDPSGSELYVTDFNLPNLKVASPTSPGLPLLVTVNGRAGQAFALLLSVPDGGQASEPSRAVRVTQGSLDATGSFVLQGSLPADPALLGFTADLVALVGPAPLTPAADLTNTVRVVVE